MSYEGYTEYITKSGNYLVVDAYETDPPVDMNDPIEWWHPVDETNGFDPHNPSTFSAEIKVIDRRVVEKQDAFGNTWSVFEYKVAPDSSHWRKY